MESKELKKERRQLGLNQKEFAEYLRVPYQTYVSWELGRRRIPGMLELALVTVRAEIEKEKEGRND